MKAPSDFRGTLSWRRTPTFERKTEYSKAADIPLRLDLRAQLLRNHAPFRLLNNMPFPRFPCLFPVDGKEITHSLFVMKLFSRLTPFRPFCFWHHTPKAFPGRR